MDAIEGANESGSKLMSSLKNIIQDAEKMLENSATQGSESFQKAKAKLESTLMDAKFALRELEEVLARKAKDAAVCAVEYAKTHPWHAAGAVAAVGVLVGLLLARRR
ncbi:MAG: DUF883 family protein [Burkholderiaceae bacterium]|jgi:ElaB/YqjD/DUF883 family membrane-anchored ribosome-binding protein|nr:DUF883 family protein [Burkholderiaceae bacterium]